MKKAANVKTVTTKKVASKAKTTKTKTPPARPVAKPTRKPSRPTDSYKTQVLPPQGVTDTYTEPFYNCTCTAADTAKEQKPTLEEIRNRIELEAYLLAEKDGFRGNPHDYWVEAERQITASL